MSNHYFSKKPTSKHHYHEFQEKIKGVELTFRTDSGVFSKGGLDYGSKVLIEHMEIEDHSDVLDVGCGYGPIGLFAAAIGKVRQVTMIDINERAIELAKHNAKRNSIDNVEIMQSNLFEKLEGRRFYSIYTNPPIRAGKEIVHRILAEAKEHLVEGGSLWVVIQKKQGAPSAYEKMREIYSEVIEVTKDKGYRVYQAVR